LIWNVGMHEGSLCIWWTWIVIQSNSGTHSAKHIGKFSLKVVTIVAF